MRRSRVLVLGKYPPLVGGTAQHTTEWVTALSEAGVTVDLVTVSAPDSRWVMSETDRPTPSIDGITVHRVGERRRRYTTPDAAPWVTMLAAKALKLGTHTTYDAIIAFPLEPFGVAGLIASKTLQVPLVLSHAGSDLFDLARLPELEHTYREVVSSARYTACTLKGARELLRLGARLEQLVPLRTADVEVEVPLERRSEGPLRVLHYGKIAPGKDLTALVSAVRDVAAAGGRVNLTIIGDGPDEYKAALRNPLREARELGADVRIKPFLNRLSLLEEVRNADYVAFLETNAHNPGHVSRIPSEAVALGTCVLGTSYGLSRAWPLNEEPRHLENCYIVDDSRGNTISKALLYGLRDPSKLQLMASNAALSLQGQSRPGLNAEDLSSYVASLITERDSWSTSFQSEVEAFQLLADFAFMEVAE